MENTPGRVGAICWEFRIASLVPRSGIVHIDSVETIPISKSATALKLYRLLPRTPIHMSCRQSIALSDQVFSIVVWGTVCGYGSMSSNTKVLTGQLGG